MQAILVIIRAGRRSQSPAAFGMADGALIVVMPRMAERADYRPLRIVANERIGECARLPLPGTYW
jgi:hypothetical protein